MKLRLWRHWTTMAETVFSAFASAMEQLDPTINLIYPVLYLEAKACA